jgi:hypothetical protein
MTNCRELSYNFAFNNCNQTDVKNYEISFFEVRNSLNMTRNMFTIGNYDKKIDYTLNATYMLNEISDNLWAMGSYSMGLQAVVMIYVHTEWQICSGVSQIWPLSLLIVVLLCL